MNQCQSIQNLLGDSNKLKQLLDIRIKEETNRLDGINGTMPNEFCFFETAPKNNTIKNEYEKMVNQYVFYPEDKIAFDVAMDTLRIIHSKLKQNTTWLNYSI